MPEQDVELIERQRLPYCVSPTDKIHLSSDKESPDCGQVIGGKWSWIHEDEFMNPEEVARKYCDRSFCTKCFDRSYKLRRIAREAYDDYRGF